MKKLFVCAMAIALLSSHISMNSLASENQGAESKQDVRSLQSVKSTPSSMPMMILREDGTIEFREAWHLPDDSLMDALYMADKLTGAVNRETLELEFGTAIDIIQQDPTMGLLGTLNSTIHQEDANVELMSARLVDFLANAVSVELTEAQLGAYEETITSTFLNLSSVDTGWMQWKESSASFTSYLYNLFFAVEKNGRLLGMPVGLTVSANASKEEFLCGASFTNYDYSVNVKAVKIMKFN
ncbi:hypothetical protein [Chengkuizengella sediminis]|uniref:hypothetical protein n=1 Tax=Chengkuizengella sediminis TaxID=1885917 RepID=UPI00138A3921|nr:hypothetical protein [Chengkuizengella sediminis]NDI34562.1 hypothetical protein [Chengkuizengella sediminis]